ncbi:hypothetical protein HBB04_05149 [Pseudomonas coronafaciens]|nr:hypothetical protein HBB04_05149 [Pseudomonas coronafaciens]
MKEKDYAGLYRNLPFAVEGTSVVCVCAMATQWI